MAWACGAGSLLYIGWINTKVLLGEYKELYPISRINHNENNILKRMHVKPSNLVTQQRLAQPCRSTTL